MAPLWPCVKFPEWVFAIVRSGDKVVRIVVGSFAVLLPVLVSPPPETVAVLVTVTGALLATLTVRVMGGWLAPGARVSLRVQGPEGGGQIQPLPDMAVAVRPSG